MWLVSRKCRHPTCAPTSPIQGNPKDVSRRVWKIRLDILKSLSFYAQHRDFAVDEALGGLGSLSWRHQKKATVVARDLVGPRVRRGSVLLSTTLVPPA
jgi:hypothetical protein